MRTQKEKASQCREAFFVPKRLAVTKTCRIFAAINIFRGLYEG